MKGIGIPGGGSMGGSSHFHGQEVRAKKVPSHLPWAVGSGQVRESEGDSKRVGGASGETDGKVATQRGRGAGNHPGGEGCTNKKNTSGIGQRELRPCFAGQVARGKRNKEKGGK